MIEPLKHLCLLGCLLVAACGSDASPEPPEEKPEPDPRVLERPEGWDDASHGEDAAPDYERVFSDLRVHRLDIEMSAETEQVMLDDMKRLLGEPGTRMGPGGFMVPPALTMACEGKQANEDCMFEATAGSCREVPGALLCLPKDGGFPGMPPGGMRPGGMGPGGMGPIDLVPEDPTYVPVTVRYDGAVWTQVAMRFKGNSSLASAWSQGRLKLGFRLHFDRYEEEHPEIDNQRFYGFRELTFSSGWNDAALIRDAIAAELLRSQGLPAARAAFYRVYVDAGEGPVYWGLYTMIEDPSDAMLESQFGSADGNLYKPDGTGADFSQFSEEGFVKKTNELAADYSDVMRLFAALQASREDAEAWRAQLESAFDVSGFLRTLALSRAIGHWDSYGRMAHNYYLYGDPAQGGRLVWISWDHNLTWQGGGGFGFGDLTPMMDEVTDRWPLIRAVLDDEVYRAEYRAALAEALEGAYAKEAFDARAAELHALIAPYVLGEGDGDPEAAPYTHLANGDAFRNALDHPMSGLFEQAEQRRQKVRDALATE